MYNKIKDTLSYSEELLPNWVRKVKQFGWRMNYLFIWLVAIGWVAMAYASTWFNRTTDDEAFTMCNDLFDKELREVKKSNEDLVNYCYDNYKDNPISIKNCTTQIKPVPTNSCVNQKSPEATTLEVVSVGEPPKIQVVEKTLRSRLGLGNCRYTNSSHAMNKYNLRWLAYDFACEVGKSFAVYSPWDYVIEKIGYWLSMGNYIILKKNDTRIVLAHIETPLEEGAELKEGMYIGNTNVSWQSTWVHLHVELWHWYMNVSSEYALWLPYEEHNGTDLLTHRNWDFWQPKWDVYYFTAYNLWDVNQNDSTPCIWASWKDLCHLEASGIRTMALTSDIRRELGVKFWDKVRLVWEKGCEGIFQVEDEMNKRFRQTPWVRRPWTSYYIKWDLPSMPWGACSIIKL